MDLMPDSDAKSYDSDRNSYDSNPNLTILILMPSLEILTRTVLILQLIF